MVLDVSILGSCVSRDIFNSRFVPNHKNYFSLKSYGHQPSIISIMSECIPFEYTELEGKSASSLDKDHFSSELEKPYLKTLYINQPNIIILDFYSDVMYGVEEADDSYIVGKSFRFKNYKAYNRLNIGKKYFPRENFEEFYELWKSKFDEFMEYVGVNIPNAKIIINKARAKNLYLDENGEERIQDDNREVEQINLIWDKLDKYAIENFNLDSMDYSKDNFYLDNDHPFGAFIVHFEQKYYDLYFSKLLKVCKNDLQDKPTENKEYPDVNVLNNVDLKYGIAFWTRWDSNIFYGKLNKENVIVIDEAFNESDIKTQCWSSEAEINADGNAEYILSLEVRARDLDKSSVLFCIRTFSKKHLTKYADCIESYDLKVNDFNISNKNFVRIEYVFKPKSKYIKVAPFVFRNGHVEYKNIRLVRKNNIT